MNLERLYSHRFEDKDNTPIWKEICLFFNKKFISKEDIICDVACGNGEFINNINAHVKYGVDLRKSKELKNNIHFLQKNVLNLKAEDFEAGVPNVFFMSNFLEHLGNKSEVFDLFCSIKNILINSEKEKKSIIILGPNIDYVKEKYWDFFDHTLPFNNKSIAEGLYSAGFKIDCSIDKFLPYTTKSCIPQHRLLVKMYLKMNFMWKILGKQFLVIGGV